MRSRFLCTIGLIGWFTAGLPFHVYGQTYRPDGFVAIGSPFGGDQLNTLTDPFLDEGEQVIGQPAGPPPTPRHTGVKAMVKDLGDDFLHLPSKENLFWAGLGGGLALA